MIPKGLFTQIAMVILAGGIIFTYIKPEFTEISDVQDNIEVYKTEREKVSSVNLKLASLVATLDDISPDDQHRLFTYLPDTVDDIAILRDLLLISLESGVLYKDASYAGDSKKSKRSSNNRSSAELLPLKQEVTLSVEGTYSQLKNLFTLIEQNHYPLEVHAITVAQVDEEFLGATITLVTYSYQGTVSDI